MAIYQTAKQSDLEKRLNLLRRQLYGREFKHKPFIQQESNTLSKASISSEINFLRQDLLKISILASLALSTQFILFYLSKINVLNLNLF